MTCRVYNSLEFCAYPADINSSMNYPLPVIKRAREYRIYDDKGRRYLDLFQESGKALLGHRQHKLSLDLKNTISRGLLSAYPSVYHRRIEKVLRKIIPAGYNGIFVSSDMQQIFKAFPGIIGRSFTYQDIAEPLLDETGELTWWRPFLKVEYPDIIFPVVPLTGSFAFTVAAVKQKNYSFSCSGISALTAIAVSRVLHNLDALISEDPYSRLKMQLPGWDRKGPYLVFKGDEKQYNKIYMTGLKTGVLLSPGFPSFSIIPACYDEGEIRAFLREIDND